MLPALAWQTWSFAAAQNLPDTKFEIQTFEIETKAGIKFFENAANSSSNFAKQSFNSLTNVNKLENYKVFLNPEIKNTLSNTDKLKVINAWKNWKKIGLENNSPIIITKLDIIGSNANQQTIKSVISLK